MKFVNQLDSEKTGELLWEVQAEQKWSKFAKFSSYFKTI